MSENFSSEVDMDKKTAGLVGAISALVTISAVEAARAQEVTDVLNARSYAELASANSECRRFADGRR